MADTLKALPFLTVDDYKWRYSIPHIRLMTYDATRVIYLSEKQIEMRNATVINSAEDLINDLGGVVLTRDK